MRYARLFSRFSVFLIALALGACNLSSGGSVPTPTSAGSTLPVVTIISPRAGDEVALNQKFTISVSASDGVGITRIQLFANGSIAQTAISETTGGDLTLNALMEYTPTQTGVLNLQAIAYRGAVSSLPAEVALTVIQAGITQIVPTGPVITYEPPILSTYDPTCRLVTNTSVNLRTGPGTNYDRILILNAGATTLITGRTADNSWWQVRVNTVTGWVSGQYVTLYGNCSSVIVPPIPPTPTSIIPTWTVQPATATRTPQPPTASPTPGLPDLIIPTIAGAATLNLGPGNTPVASQYTFTVTNTGQGPTTQFSSTVTVSPPGAPPQPLSVVAGLAPGESITLTIDLIFSAAGTYTLQGRADSDSQITEASEVNNIGFFTVTVNSTP